VKKVKNRLFVLLLIAGIYVVLSAMNQGGSSGKSLHQQMADFQRAIGGVGLGAVMVPAWNFRDFDPRLQQSSYDSLFPIPAGYSYSPDRLSMVTSFAEEK